jgi:hypothetical protein
MFSSFKIIIYLLKNYVGLKEGRGMLVCIERREEGEDVVG